MKRLLVLIIIVTFIFSGCEKRKVSEKKIITIMTWAAGNELKEMEAYLNLFRKEHIDIEVKPIYVNIDYDQKLSTMIAGGTPPDIFRVSEWTFFKYLDKDVYLDLKPLIESDPSFDLSDFIPASIDIFSYKGHIYGLPAVYQPVVLYYNQDLFDKEGLAYPDRYWTWDTLLGAAKRLTKDIDGDGKIDQYGFDVEPSLFTWVSFIWQNEGKFFEQGKWVFNKSPYKERNQETLQFLVDLIHNHKVSMVPGAGLWASMSLSEMFQSGRVAMLYSAPFACLQFKDMKFRWNIVELPYKKCRASFIGGVDWSVSTKSKNKEEAWELVKFLVSPKLLSKSAKSGWLLSPRKSLFSSKIFLEEMTELNREAYIRAGKDYPYSYNNFPAVWYYIKSEVFDQEIEKLFLGLQTVSKTMDNIEKGLKLKELMIE